MQKIRPVKFEGRWKTDKVVGATTKIIFEYLEHMFLAGVSMVMVRLLVVEIWGPEKKV